MLLYKKERSAACGYHLPKGDGSAEDDGRYEAAGGFVTVAEGGLHRPAVDPLEVGEDGGLRTQPMMDEQPRMIRRCIRIRLIPRWASSCTLPP